jgi:hypothetical protein
MDNYTFHPTVLDPEEAEKWATETFAWLQCAESWLEIIFPSA